MARIHGSYCEPLITITYLKQTPKTLQLETRRMNVFPSSEALYSMVEKQCSFSASPVAPSGDSLEEPHCNLNQFLSGCWRQIMD